MAGFSISYFFVSKVCLISTYRSMFPMVHLLVLVSVLAFTEHCLLLIY